MSNRMLGLTMLYATPWHWRLPVIGRRELRHFDDMAAMVGEELRRSVKR